MHLTYILFYSRPCLMQGVQYRLLGGPYTEQPPTCNRPILLGQPMQFTRPPLPSVMPIPSSCSEAKRVIAIQTCRYKSIIHHNFHIAINNQFLHVFATTIHAQANVAVRDEGQGETPNGQQNYKQVTAM